MRESYFYQLALTKKLRQLLVLVFLLSAHIGAWATFDYGVGITLSYNSSENSYVNYANGIKWTVSGATPSNSTFSGFTDMRLTFNKKLTGNLLNIELTSSISSDAKVDIKAYSTSSISENGTTLLGRFTFNAEDATYTFTPEENNHISGYLQLAFVAQTGEEPSIEANQITGIALTFEGTSYDLTVAGIRATSANADIPLVEDANGYATYNSSTHTLTLNNIVINGTIQTGREDLIIDIIGTSQINAQDSSAIKGTVATNALPITFKSSSGSSPKLTLVPQSSYNAIEGLTPTYDDNLCISPATLSNGTTAVISKSYGLTVGGITVSEANASNIFAGDETNDGKVSFDGTNTLTLEGANITASGTTAAIVSGLDNLTIVLKGRNDISFAYNEQNNDYNYNFLVSSSKASANLTFEAIDDDTEGSLWTTYGTSNYTPFDGFNEIIYDSDLAYFPGTDCQYVGRIKSPSITLSRDGLTITSENDYSGNTLSFYYTIDYADDTEDITTPTLYSEQNRISIDHPCTITAYTQYAYNSSVKNSSSNPTTAKYYGFAEPMRVVFNGTPSELTNLPALIPGGDDVTYEISGSSDEKVISFLEETGKCTIKGYGRVYLTAAIPEDVLPLNDGCEATLTVNVVPDAPTFKIGDNAITGNVTYDEAQTLTIVPDVLGDNITIKYYEGTDETSTTTYEEEINIDETKTINAWVEYYDATNKTTLYGDTASVTITIRQNPGLAYKLGEVQATTVTATIGETFTQPTLENPNSLDITYTSSVPGVATIAADGTITLVGIGTTVIKAETAQTETLLAGSAEYTLNVLKQLSHETITITVGAATYTGEAVTPTVTVKDGETEISSDLYDIEYSNNTAAATAEDTDAPTVTIIAKENLQDAMNYYTGQATKKFTIAGRSISDFTISLSVETFEYNGSAQTPTVTFTEEGQTKEMTENTDYTLTYANNTNAGSASAETAPQVTITGTGNYTGEVVKKFSITAKDLEGATISDIEDQTFTGSQIKPEPTVTIVLIAGAEATTLVTGTDFDYSYSNNTDAATSQNVYAPTVTITGKGNYSGTKTAKFNIAKADPTITKAPEAKTLTYTGEAQALIEAGTATGGNLTYSLEEEGTYSTDIPTGTDRGNYTVYYKVEGDINHNNTSAQSLAVTIAAKALSNDMIQAIDNQTYTGEAIEPVITVKDGETTLTGDDYAVSYANNTNASTEASVTITAKEDGNYSGTATRTFTIEAKNISGVYAIALDTQDYIYTGSEIKPAITVNNQEGNSLTSETDYTVAYSNNINLGTTEGGDNAPTITVTGKGNYSGTITAKFNIRPKSIADESITIEPIADQAYTGEAITPTITVKDGEKTLTKDTDYTVSYNGDNTSVTPEGSETLPTVIITGAGNYDSTTTKSVTFKIVAATATITVTETTQEVTYNGQPQAITGVSVTKGTTKVTYYTSEADRSKGSNALGETPTDAGTYYVQVTQDDANYASTPVDVTFTIKKAAITEVTLENNSLTFTGEEQSVTIASVKAGTLELSADDYTVSGEKATVIGTNTVTVTAKDESNYSGSASADYSIVAKNLTDAMVSLTITTYDYDGTAKKPAVTVKDGEQVLTLNTDFTVAYTDSINAGTATATIFGTGNYGGTVTKTYTINQVSLEGVTIEAIADQAFTGSAVEPTVTVTFNGFTVSSDDYTVSYSNNINAGEATVTLTSTNRNFTEGSTKTATFTINNRAIDAATKESLFEGGKEYASYYSATEDLSLGEGIAAYIITGVSGNSVITTPLSYIPKGVPVLLESINGTSTETGTATDGNMLRYATTATTIPSSDGTAYVLYNNMYVRVTNNAIPAGKSYLLVPATVNIGGSARQLAISHGGDAAGIDAIEWNDGDKEVWFDLQGRRIDRPTKAGLYIKNGQKTVVK